MLSPGRRVDQHQELAAGERQHFDADPLFTLPMEINKATLYTDAIWQLGTVQNCPSAIKRVWSLAV